MASRDRGGHCCCCRRCVRRRGAAPTAVILVALLLLPLVAGAFQDSLNRERLQLPYQSQRHHEDRHRRRCLNAAPAPASASRHGGWTFKVNARCRRRASEPSQPLACAAFPRIMAQAATRRPFALPATRAPSSPFTTEEDANDRDMEQRTDDERYGDHGDDAASNSSPALLRSVTFCVSRAEEPDLMCEFLMEVGAVATSLTDAHAGTEHETALFGEPVVGTVHGGAYHRHDVWDLCNVTALFPDSANLRDVVDLVQSSFLSRQDDDGANEQKLEVQVRTVDDRDWVVHVQQSWKPIVAGRFVLKFPWHDDAAVQQALQLASVEEQANSDDARRQDDKVDPIVLELQGGVAFGTGEHATTQLCLQWVEDVVSQRLAGHEAMFEVLDYGSGSGILGMAACALDRARVSSIGIDIDVDACRIANDNARQNRINMRNYLPPSALLQTDPDDAVSQSLLLKAHRQAQLFRRRDGDDEEGAGNTSNADSLSVILPDELDQRTFPIVVANILASPLTMLAPSLMRRVAPGGRLGLSGVLHHQAESVLRAYEQEGLVNGIVQRQLGDWVLITGSRPSA